MQRRFAFTWLCIKIAVRGNAAPANDWQWVIANPIWQGIGGTVGATVGGYLAKHWQSAPLIWPNTPIGIFLGGLFGFVVTWIILFIIRFLRAPAILFYQEKERADGLQSQLEKKLYLAGKRDRSGRDDIPVREAFATIIRNLGDRIKLDSSETEKRKFAATRLRKIALEGCVRLYGREFDDDENTFAEIASEIPKDFWKKSQFDLDNIYSHDSELKTQTKEDPRHALNTCFQADFGEIAIDKDELEIACPPANISA